MFASLFTSVSNTAVKERRRAVRRRIDAAGELRACSRRSPAAVMSVVVRDVSATGIGIMHDVPLAVGQKFAVKQDAVSADTPGLFTIVRSDAMPDGRYGIGLHATHLLDPRAALQRGRGANKMRAVLAVVASVVIIVALIALMMY
jgi:hypothetical protein